MAQCHASRGRFRRRLRAPKPVSTQTVQVDLYTIVSDNKYVGRFGSMKMNILVGSMLLSASLCGQSFGGDLLSRLLGGHGCGASSSCCDTSVSDPSCGAEMAASCGSGCGAAPSCGPSCGAEIASCGSAPGCGSAPSCGVESACCAPRRPILSALRAKLSGLKSRLSCNSGCGSSCDPCGAPACGPSCGAEMASCGSGCGAAPSCGAEMASCRSGCGAAPSCGPSCGAEIAACDPCGPPSCDSGRGCKLGKRGLLAKIFKCKSNSCCDAPASCDSGCNSCGTSSGCSSSGGGTAISAPMSAPMAAPAPVVDPHAYINTKRHVIQASSTRIR